MKCLAIDTSSSYLTIALIDGNDVYTEYVENCNLKHSTTLMPKIEELLNKSQIKLSEIDVFCSCVGPGSFTGIRIGVSTIKAFAYALNKKVVKVTSFDVLAYNKRSGKNLAVIDANHDNFYVQGYDGLNAITEPSFVNVEQLNKIKREYDEVLTFSDLDFCKKNADVLSGFINAVKSNLVNATCDIESVVPTYIRKSQAEEGV